MSWRCTRSTKDQEGRRGYCPIGPPGRTCLRDRWVLERETSRIMLEAKKRQGHGLGDRKPGLSLAILLLANRGQIVKDVLDVRYVSHCPWPVWLEISVHQSHVPVFADGSFWGVRLRSHFKVQTLLVGCSIGAATKASYVTSVASATDQSELGFDERCAYAKRRGQWKHWEQKETASVLSVHLQQQHAPTNRGKRWFFLSVVFYWLSRTVQFIETSETLSQTLHLYLCCEYFNWGLFFGLRGTFS